MGNAGFCPSTVRAKDRGPSNWNRVPYLRAALKGPAMTSMSSLDPKPLKQQGPIMISISS